jgi:hypothetical protein
MEDIGAHRVQERPLGLDVGRVAAAEQRERARVGTAHAAADRAVDHGHAASPGALGEGQELGQGDGAADHHGAAGHGVEEAVAPAQRRVDLRPAHHHHHDAPALGADLRRMARGPAASRDEARERLGGDVVGEHVMAGLEEIGGHAEAHLAQPDESDGAR